MKNPAITASLASRLALGAFCYSAFVLSCQGANLFWDANGNATDGVFGGNGTWSASAQNWNSTATNNDDAGVLQGWIGGFDDSARFLRGLSADVTADGTIQVTSINFGFSAGSYTAGSGGVTNLTGGTFDLRTSNVGVVLQTANGATANIGSNINLFGGLVATQAIRATSGPINISGNITDISGTGSRTLALESFGGSVTIDGNITRSGSSTLALSLGGGSGTGQSNGGTYTLNGTNTGLNGAVTLSRGSLVINNGAAINSATGITVANANTASGSGDTARVLIGTAGVSVSRTVSFSSLTATDTNDVRVIGGQNTTGVATFTNTVTVNAMAASGTGSYVQFTAEAGGRVDFTGSINGVGAIRKVGDGVVALSRPNAGSNHSGGITVEAGTLLANGFNSTGASAITVNNTATLGGNNTVAGPITVNAGGRISPGDMAADNATSLTGTLAAGSSLTWNSDNITGGMRFDLGVDQAASDQITLVGAFTKGSGSSFIFDFTDLGVTQSFSYTLLTFGSTDFLVGDFVATGIAGTFNLGANSLTFTTAIPEPSAFAALAGLAGLGLAASRRRRA